MNDRTDSTASGAVGAIADSAVLENLNETERIAARRRRGMEQASVGRTKATKTLKQLAEKSVLAWIGKGTNDPYQCYRLNESAHDSQLTARGRAVGCYGPDSCNRPLRHARSHREMHSARPGTSPPTPRTPIRDRRIDQPTPDRP